MSSKKKPTKAAEAKSKSSIVSPKVLDELVDLAKDARKNAYAPYSKYKVGAAVATKSGKTFVGCNVENASYGATICAERGAVMAMVAAGETEIAAVAVVTEDGGSPCGMCRQVLSEFTKDAPIALVSLHDKDGEVGQVLGLDKLLPLQFELRK